MWAASKELQSAVFSRMGFPTLEATLKLRSWEPGRAGSLREIVPRQPAMNFTTLNPFLGDYSSTRSACEHLAWSGIRSRETSD
jgi:hypothetical protein